MSVREALDLVAKVQDLMETKDEESLDGISVDLFETVSDETLGVVYRAREIVYRRWTIQTRRELAEASKVRAQ